MKYLSKQSGVTISDLLISLAILGLIAANCIPKIIFSGQRSEAKAKVLEAVSILEQAWYALRNTDVVSNGIPINVNLVGDPVNAIAPMISTAQINFLKQITQSNGALDPQMQSSGCNFIGNSSSIVLPYVSQASAIQLPDGIIMTLPVTVSGTDQNEILCIDYNGTLGPNQDGVDTFYFNFNSTGDFLYTNDFSLKSFWYGNNSLLYLPVAIPVGGTGGVGAPGAGSGSGNGGGSSGGGGGGGYSGASIFSFFSPTAYAQASPAETTTITTPATVSNLLNN